jgi:hypothetical protein
MNSNWIRWIQASICEHANTNRGGVKLFIEGEKRITDTTADRFELRTNGPMFNEISNGIWRTQITLNLLISCNINKTDLYTLDRKIGIAMNIFTTILVYKYGVLSGTDDQSLLTCLHIVDGPTVTRYGQINPSIEVVQATVQGHYKTLLED